MADTRLLEQKGGVSFLECLEACLHSDLLKEWERLQQKTLIARDPLHRVIDQAAGYDLAVMQEFADFVYVHVFLTLPIVK